MKDADDMKVWTLGALVAAVLGSATYTIAATPSVPLPTPSPIVVAQAQAQPQPAPAPVPQPQVAAQQTASPPLPPPSWLPQNLLWIWTAIGTVIATLKAKDSFLPNWPSPTLVAAAPAAPTDPTATTTTGDAPVATNSVLQIVQAIFHPQGTAILADPALRAQIDGALLQLIKSGQPGALIQSGVSMAIPAAGPIVAALEPALRNIVETAITNAQAKHAAAAAPAGP